jgi:hypothetical protein
MVAGNLAMVVICGTSLHAQTTAPAGDLQAALRNFAAADDYGWTCIGRRGVGDDVVEGKTQNGVIALSVTFQDNTASVLIKGDSAIVNTLFGWTPAAVIIEATPNYGRTPNPNFYAAYLTQGYKPPAVVVGDLRQYLQNIQPTADGYSADLAPDGAGQLLVHTRTYNLDRSAVPTITEATGSIKLSIKDGMLTGYETHASGISTFNASGRAVDQTFVVRIRDVGATTVDVPPEALEVLNPAASQPSGQ